MVHEVELYQFALMRLITNPDLFFEHKNRVYLINDITGDYHYLTPPDSPYVRHALRAIASAEDRFNATIDAHGRRIPCVDLPVGLHDARMINTREEAQLLALRKFSDSYTGNEARPNITILLNSKNEEA